MSATTKRPKPVFGEKVLEIVEEEVAAEDDRPLREVFPVGSEVVFTPEDGVASLVGGLAGDLGRVVGHSRCGAAIVRPVEGRYLSICCQRGEIALLS